MKRLILFLILVSAVSTAAFCSNMPTAENTETGTPISKNLVLKYCKWYISTPPPTDSVEIEARKAIAALIVTYAVDTEEFSINMGDAVGKMLGLDGTNSNPDLLGAYLAGEIIYCLEHGLKTSDAASFASAMNDVVNFYSMLPEHNTKSLNEYLDMDKSERIKRFEKFYKKNH